MTSRFCQLAVIRLCQRPATQGNDSRACRKQMLKPLTLLLTKTLLPFGGEYIGNRVAIKRFDFLVQIEKRQPQIFSQDTADCTLARSGRAVKENQFFQYRGLPSILVRL